MDSSTVHNVYSISVAVTHVLFAVILLRLYQLVKKAKLCQDTWVLRIGIVLAVTGTLTLASIPLHPSGFAADNEVMWWSISRTLGLIVLCFVLFKTLIHPPTAKPAPWDGQERRESKPEDHRFFRDTRGEDAPPSNRIPLA